MPSLLLQPLIENAVKYAIAPSVAGGSIEISARRMDSKLLITVADSGPGCAELPHGNGVGLRNTFERLKVLYGARSTCTAQNRAGGGFEVRLEFPFEAHSQ